MPPADTRRAFTGAPCGAPANKCLHVLSSFQRTGFHDAPHQLYFLRGNPPILRMRPCPVKPPEPASRFFIDAPTVARFSHAPALTIADELCRALQCDLGVLRAEGSVVRLRAHRASSERRVTLGPTTICPDSGSVNRSNRLAFQLGRPRCRASFVRDRLTTIQAARGGVN
jgi:hypothetical protein